MKSVADLRIIRIRKFLTWNRIVSTLSNRKRSLESLSAKTATAEKKSSKLDKIKYFFQTEWQTWDFCLFDKSQHRNFLKKIETQRDRKIYVLVGHPKSLEGSTAPLDFLLRKLKKCRFETMQNLIDILASDFSMEPTHNGKSI